MASAVCAEHPDLAARESCGRCGRPVCLDCAIPVRGAVRCARCVREEVGEPIPDPSPPRRADRVDPIAAALFLAALVISILPWGSDRAGLFSAWAPRPDPWPMVTIALVAGAAGLSLRRRVERRRVLHVVLGGLGVLVGLIALPGPGFATRTVVPFLVVSLATLATGLGAGRLAGWWGGSQARP